LNWEQLLFWVPFRDTPYIYYVGFGNNTQLHVDGSMAGAVNNNKGYIIEAEDLVYVSASLQREMEIKQANWFQKD